MSTPAEDDAAGSAQGSSMGRKIALATPLVIFSALAVIFAYLLTADRDTSAIPSPFIGKAAPNFDLPPLPGLKQAGVAVPGASRADLEGKVSLVNIFASWCAPCRQEHPALVALAKREGLNVIGVNYKDKDENALRFLGALGNPYDRVGVDPRGRASIDWGFYGIPETFLIGPDGTVLHKIVGPITNDKFLDLQKRIDALLAKPKESS